jgi:hypothetical protein
MSSEVYAVVLLFHLLAMLFMAAPLYMLVIVNERARFTIPASYNTDRYMENIIKNQPARCYAYLGVIVVTGLLLTWNKGLWTDWALIIKLVVTAALFLLLSYVHRGIQPQVEAILDKVKPGEEIPASERPTLVKWRMRRKRLSATCLFLVLTALIMGLRVTLSYSPLLVAVFMVLAALFAWRAYRVPVRLGWF